MLQRSIEVSIANKIMHTNKIEDHRKQIKAFKEIFDREMRSLRSAELQLKAPGIKLGPNSDANDAKSVSYQASSLHLDARPLSAFVSSH